jgi:hypothetical protein
MRRRSATALVILSAAVFTACLGDDDGDADETVPTTTTTTVAAAIEPPPVTTPPTDPSTTTASTTTTPSTTLPPTTAPAEPEPACLDGSWWLSPEQTTALYASLLPGIPVTVTGTHWAEFSGGAVDYWAVLEIRFTVGGTDVTFGLDQHGVGSYTVADDVLTMAYDTFESTIHEGHGNAITDPDQHPESYADEAIAIVDNGNGTITIDRVTVPVIEIPPVAGGPIGCDDETMSLGFTSGLADSAAVYVRRG